MRLRVTVGVDVWIGVRVGVGRRVRKIKWRGVKSKYMKKNCNETSWWTTNDFSFTIIVNPLYCSILRRMLKYE